MKKTFILLLIGISAFSQNQTDKDFYFSANVNPSSNKTVYSISQQYDNKIIIGLTSLTLSDANQYLKRLNIDGTTDNSFSPPSMIVRTDKIVIQNDNKILISTSGSGTGSVGRNFARLNTDGSLDQQFQNNLSYITGNIGGVGISIQADNKILAPCYCTSVENINIKGLLRLNSDGLRDTNFNLQGNGYAPFAPAKTLQLQNGKILTLGRFSSYNNISYNPLGVIKLFDF